MEQFQDLLLATHIVYFIPSPTQIGDGFGLSTLKNTISKFPIKKSFKGFMLKKKKHQSVEIPVAKKGGWKIKKMLMGSARPIRPV